MGHGKESSAFATIPSTKSRSQAHSHAHSGAHAHAHSSSNVRSSSVDRSDLRHYQKRSTLAAGGSSSAMSEQREGGTFSERHVRGSSSNINASSQG